MSSGATPSGTQTYFERIPLSNGNSPVPFGQTGWLAGPVGFSADRLTNADPNHREALKKALLCGCNLIATSFSRRDPTSQELVGDVLQKLFSEKIIARSEIILAAKLGDFAGTTVSSPSAHAPLEPEHIQLQITLSLKRLQVDCLDICLLHRPEVFFQTHGSPAEYYQNIRAVFKAFCHEAKQGRIQTFGISSLSLTEPKESDRFTSLDMLAEIAAEVAKEMNSQDYFKVIEFPLNVLEPGAALERNNSRGSVLETAQQLNLATLTDRPLNAFAPQGLIRLTDPPRMEATATDTLAQSEVELQEALAPLMQLETHYEGSHLVPRQKVAWGHFIRENFHQIRGLEHWKELLRLQIEPALNAITEILSKELSLLPWLDEYKFRTEAFLGSITRYFEAQRLNETNRIRNALLSSCPALATSRTLSQQVIRLTRSLPGISCVLVGTRTPQYVDDVFSLEPPIDAAQALATLEELATL